MSIYLYLQRLFVCTACCGLSIFRSHTSRTATPHIGYWAMADPFIPTCTAGIAVLELPGKEHSGLHSWTGNPFLGTNYLMLA